MVGVCFTITLAGSPHGPSSTEQRTTRERSLPASWALSPSRTTVPPAARIACSAAVRMSITRYPLNIIVLSSRSSIAQPSLGHRCARTWYQAVGQEETGRGNSVDPESIGSPDKRGPMHNVQYRRIHVVHDAYRAAPAQSYSGRQSKEHGSNGSNVPGLFCSPRRQRPELPRIVTDRPHFESLSW